MHGTPSSIVDARTCHFADYGWLIWGGGGGEVGAIHTHGVLDKMRRSHSFHMCVHRNTNLDTIALCSMWHTWYFGLELMCQVTLIYLME